MSFFSVKDFSFELDSGGVLFSGVSLDLDRGMRVALLGDNGAGKTTLLKALAGIATSGSAKGEIFFEGQNLQTVSLAERARKMVYLGADLRIEFPLSALDVVQLARRAARTSFLGELNVRDRQVIEESMRKAECWNLREREFSSLSGGERQCVLFARGLAQDSPLLFCDESFSRLDVDRQSRFGSLIRELSKEKTFVFVSHDVNFSLEWADRFFLLREGRLTEIESARIGEAFDHALLGIERNPFSGRPHLFFKKSP